MRAVAVSLITLNVLLLTWAGMLAFYAANRGYRTAECEPVAGVPEHQSQCSTRSRNLTVWGLEIPWATQFLFTALLSGGVVGTVLYLARPRRGDSHDFRRYTRAMLLLLGLFVIPAWFTAVVWAFTISLSWSF